MAPAVQRDVPLAEEVTGRLEATETVEIRARVPGTIENFEPSLPEYDKKAPAVQIEDLDHLFCTPQMADVNRIKRTAE